MAARRMMGGGGARVEGRPGKAGKVRMHGTNWMALEDFDSTKSLLG